MDHSSQTSPDWSVALERQVDALSDEFEDALLSGETPSLEEFLARVEEPQRERLLCELLPLELDALEDTGQTVSEDTYLRRLPQFQQGIRAVFSERLPLVSLDQFVDAISSTRLIEADELQRLIQGAEEDVSGNAVRLGRMLVHGGLLTDYQCHALLEGRKDPLVLGDYVVLEKIGRGGMGQVYKARHRRMERIVALKTLPDDVADDESSLFRFHREVKAAARLSHPNIVTAHDAREDDGVHYLVMEFVNGEDLSKLVKQRGPLPPALAAECVLQAARGLEYAHSQGVIHRDIKPSNLLVEGQGSRAKGQVARSPSALDPCPLTLKVLDMGLARLEQREDDPSATARDLTGSGTVMGTVDFMAPEQAENTKYADQRSDVYSLGMTLFYLLSGRAAYDGETVMQRLLAHREGEIPSVSQTLKNLHGLSGAAADSSVPHWQGLDDVFRKMAAKQPDDRYQTMSEVIADLEPLTQVLDVDDDTLRLDWQAAGAQGDPDARSIRVTAPTTPSPRPAAPSSATSLKPESSPAIPADDTFRSQVDDRTEIVKPSVREVVALPPERTGLPRWIGLAAAVFGIVLAGFVYRIQTNYGEVVVEIMDETVAAQLTANGIEVFDKNDPEKRWTINFAAAGEEAAEELPPGEYRAAELPGVELQITDSNGAEYNTGEFKLSRNDEVRIRIMAVTGEEPPGSGLDDAPDFALQFDGENDYVELPTLSYDGSHPITVEGWCDPNLSNVARNAELTAVCCGCLSLKVSGGRGRWQMAIWDEQQPGKNYCAREADNTDEARTHLACVWDGESERFYVNGRECTRRLVSSTDDVASLVESNSIRKSFLGCLANDDRYGGINTFFAGIIDEVRVSQTARYTENFTPAERFEPDEHTLALYHFDEGEGDVLTDSSGNDHHGTIHGSSWVKQVGPETWAPYDAPRRVSEWVINRGGSVVLNSGQITATSLDELPPEPFRVFHLKLNRIADLRGEELIPLQALTGLSLLNLQLTSINDEDLRHVSGIRIRDLMLDGCRNIDGSGLAHLSRMPGLSDLGLSNTSLTDDALAAIAGFPSLGLLSLGRTGITRAGLAHAVECPSLTALSIYETGIIDQDLELLTQRPEKWDHLILDGSQVTLTGTRHLAELSALERLEIIGTCDLELLRPLATIKSLLLKGPFSTRDVQVLSQFTHLESLEIEYTQFTEEDVQALRAALPNVRIESDFGTFGSTGIDYDNEREVAEWVLELGGTVAVRVEGRLRANLNWIPDEPFTLDSINLGNATLNEREALLEPLAQLSSPRNLLLNHPLITDDSLRNLAGLTSLSVLNLIGTAVTDDGLHHLLGLNNLTALDLAESQVSGAGLEVIGEMDQLRGIGLDGDQLTAESAAHLSRFENLRIVSLHGPTVTDECLEHLALLAGFDGRLDLKDVSAGPVAVSDVGLATIVRALPDLKELVLDTVPGITSAGLASLEELHGLWYLLIERRDLSISDLSAIGGMSELRQLELGKVDLTDELLTQLGSFSNLSLLKIYESTGDTEEGIRRLHAALPNCRIVSRFGTFGPESDESGPESSN